MGVKEETRARTVAALWHYIKAHRLQDAENKQVINLNSELKQILFPKEKGGTNFIGIEKMGFHKLLAAIKPHLFEPEPLKFTLVI